MGAGSGLAEALPGSSFSGVFKSGTAALSASLCRGDGEATAWTAFLQTRWDTRPWGASLAWGSSAPLGISACWPPFHCAHGLTTGSCAAVSLLPTSPCLQLSTVGVCTLFLLPHPKRALEICWWLFPPNASAHGPGSHCPVVPCGGISLHPFLFIPPLIPAM